MELEVVELYLADANFMIDIGERFYPQDVFTALWANLNPLLHTGQIRLTKMVIAELRRGTGQWRTPVCSGCRPHAIDEADEDVQEKFAQLSALRQRGVISRSLSDIDQFVLAAASARGCTIITRDGNLRNAASSQRVSSIDPTDLFRRMRWQF